MLYNAEVPIVRTRFFSIYKTETGSNLGGKWE